MKASDLDQRISIQEERRLANGQGGYSTSWGPVPDSEAWANIVGLSGGEAMEAGVQRNVQQWRVTIYLRPSVTPKNRLIWGGRVLDIKAAMPLPKDPRKFTLLMCESGSLA